MTCSEYLSCPSSGHSCDSRDRKIWVTWTNMTSNLHWRSLCYFNYKFNYLHLRYMWRFCKKIVIIGFHFLQIHQRRAVLTNVMPELRTISALKEGKIEFRREGAGSSSLAYRSLIQVCVLSLNRQFNQLYLSFMPLWCEFLFIHCIVRSCPMERDYLAFPIPIAKYNIPYIVFSL